MLVLVLAGELANEWDTGMLFGAVEAEPKAIVVGFLSVSEEFVQLPKAVLTGGPEDDEGANKFVAGGPKGFDDGLAEGVGAARGKGNAVGAGEPNTLEVPVVV